jgi:hypothetical protein
MEEPTDEMLAAIMKEAAADAAKRWEEAEKRFFEQLRVMVQQSVSAV